MIVVTPGATVADCFPDFYDKLGALTALTGTSIALYDASITNLVVSSGIILTGPTGHVYGYTVPAPGVEGYYRAKITGTDDTGRNVEAVSDIFQVVNGATQFAPAGIPILGIEITRQSGTVVPAGVIQNYYLQNRPDIVANFINNFDDTFDPWMFVSLDGAYVIASNPGQSDIWLVEVASGIQDFQAVTTVLGTYNAVDGTGVLTASYITAAGNPAAALTAQIATTNGVFKSTQATQLAAAAAGGGGGGGGGGSAGSM